MNETSALEPEFEKNLSETGQDLRPEFCHYRDEGCELFDSCLSCPLPQCIYDEPGGRQQLLKDLRNREITRMYIDEGRGVKELALMFGTSTRTVQRALKSSLAASSSGVSKKQCRSEDTEQRRRTQR